MRWVLFSIPILQSSKMAPRQVIVIKGDLYLSRHLLGIWLKIEGLVSCYTGGGFILCVDEAMRWPVTQGLAWVKEERGVSDEEVAEGHRKVTLFSWILGHPSADRYKLWILSSRFFFFNLIYQSSMVVSDRKWLWLLEETAAVGTRKIKSIAVHIYRENTGVGFCRLSSYMT